MNKVLATAMMISATGHVNQFDRIVKSYRAYYNGSKREMFSWKNRPTPEWISI